MPRLQWEILSPFFTLTWKFSFVDSELSYHEIIDERITGYSLISLNMFQKHQLFSVFVSISLKKMQNA